jgi:divalent metal cation (Fe/Co/Zn/Cd) transporter
VTANLPVHAIGGAPTSTPTPGPNLARRSVLIRRVRLLVAFTIAYNLIEAIVALAAGSVADSAALLGFGLDSVIEVSSAAAVAWQFAGSNHEAREKIALRVIAFSFFGLAAFVSFDATSSLVTGNAPEHSSIGIALAGLSLLIMPVASWIQRRTGHELGSSSAVADSKQTLLCTYMSAGLLLGLLANTLLGWWWADALAALFIAGLAIKEGIGAWRGDLCCSPAEVFFDHDHHDCADGPACC